VISEPDEDSLLKFGTKKVDEDSLDQNKKLHFQCLPWFGQICLVVWCKFGASKNVSVEEYVCMYLTDYWKCISFKKTLDFP